MQPMTDINNEELNQERETSAEISRRWEAMDRARRQNTLHQNWPNRKNFEAQLEAIKNVNSRQGKII